MGRYNVKFKDSLRKDLKKINKADIPRLLERINDLGDNPYPRGYKKLKGENLCRVRLGSYRVVYEVFDNELIVSVVKVGHRKGIYKKR
jgi:mRNA interferase RelE/StbE